MKRYDILSLGECMAEFTRHNKGQWRMSFAGDAYNTAVYAARLGMRAGFISAIGDDMLALEMRESWRRETVDNPCTKRINGGTTGIYFVSTDKRGERSFNYYRKDSAATQTLTAIPNKRIIGAINKSKIFYFTGVTLAVMNEWRRIVTILQSLSDDVIVAFDVNYRPKLWKSPKDFRKAWRAITPYLDYQFVSEDDLRLLGTTVTPHRFLKHATTHGTTTVLKRGARGAEYVADGKIHRVPAKRVRVVDTTAAGDAFNAGVLGAILRNELLESAIKRGNQLAVAVVQHPGAIS